MRSLKLFVLALTVLFVFASSAFAEEVVVRKDAGNNRYEYVAVETNEQVKLWGVDYLKNDGTVWGSDSNKSKEKLEKIIRSNQRLDRIVDGKPSLDFNYEHPSQIYAIFDKERSSTQKTESPFDVGQFKKFNEAVFEIQSRVESLFEDIETYKEVFKEANGPGWVLKEWGGLLGERVQKAARFQAQLLAELKRVDSPFDVGQEGINSVLSSLDDSEIRFKSEFFPENSTTDYGWTRGGKRTGNWTGFYENGQKQFSGQYKDGKDDGHRTDWYENGQKKSESDWREGKLEGRWITWHENGRKNTESNWREDKREGRSTDWYENGQKQIESEYKNGKKEGLSIQWHENGQKHIELFFRNGKRDGLSIQWHENGQKRMEGNWKDDKPDGSHRWWKEDGTFSGEAVYDRGKWLSGTWAYDEFPTPK